MKTIDCLWQKRNLPVVNGVIFFDESISQFTIEGYGKNRVIIPALKTDLKKFLADENSDMSSADRLDELMLNDGGEIYTAACGEGSNGGDGFVIVIDSKRQVRWAAIFDCSNPFVRLMQRGRELIAVSSLNEFWIFPLSAPDAFYVLEAGG